MSAAPNADARWIFGLASFDADVEPIEKTPEDLLEEQERLAMWLEYEARCTDLTERGTD